MGLLDKLKSAKNVLTGGGAEVSLQADLSEAGNGYAFEVSVTVGDADLKADQVYIIVKGEEDIEVPEADMVYTYDGDVEFHPDLVRAHHTTFENRVEFELEEGKLEANQTYNWTFEVALDEQTPAPYYGRFCQHTHSAMAGVSCFGNDPDSGWVQLG